MTGFWKMRLTPSRGACSSEKTRWLLLLDHYTLGGSVVLAKGNAYNVFSKCCRKIIRCIAILAIVLIELIVLHCMYFYDFRERNAWMLGRFMRNSFHNFQPAVNIGSCTSSMRLIYSKFVCFHTCTMYYAFVYLALYLISVFGC